jgi:cytochrome c biogenesis protein
MEPKEEKQKSRNILLTVTAGLGRFFSSVRLAIFLILSIAALSLVGAVLIQVPPEFAAEPHYSGWLVSVAQAKFGFFTPLLAWLGLFDVFHSIWFVGFGGLLITNIIICSLNRSRSIRMLITGSPVRQTEEFYMNGTGQAELPSRMDTGEAATSVSRILGKEGYRVRSESSESRVYIAADKNRYCRLGTYLSHLSLILFIIGFLIGSYFGFRNDSLVVPEGASRAVGYDTGLTLYLESFADEYWPGGMPKDYRSEVVINDAKGEVARGTIRVNHPLGYRGVDFYQSSFGPAAKVQIRRPAGEVIYEDSIALSGILTDGASQYRAGVLNLPQRGMSIRLIAPISCFINKPGNLPELAFEIYRDDSPEPVVTATLKKDVPHELLGLELIFLGETRYSGFKVSHDPGNMLIWIASGFFILGLTAALYFPYRQVGVLVAPGNCDGSRLYIRSVTRERSHAAPELPWLAKNFERESNKIRKSREASH